MSDSEEKLKPSENETPVSPLSGNDTAFIREQIKARPISKRKILRRTLLTVAMAVVFGIVACLTFLLLEPLFTRITKEEEPQIISFPASDDEINPEDLYKDDAEIASAQEQIVAESIQASIEASEQDRINAAIETALSRHTLDEADTASMYRAMKAVAIKAGHALVNVRAAAKQEDFVGGTIELNGEAPGLVIANNGVEMLILTYSSILSEGSELSVTWENGVTNEASVKLSDPESGLLVLAVPKRLIDAKTRETIVTISLGSSISTSLTGVPVIAIGSPVGIYRSVSYGMIASEKFPVDLTDKALRLFATDIYGGGDSSGFLVDLSGSVVGIIYPGKVEGVDEQRIVAFSISESKKLIEHLVNATPLPYLGIHGTDIPPEIMRTLPAPGGAFVLRTEVNSPSMTAGLQSGDIILSVNDRDVSSWESFILALEGHSPGDEVRLNILRPGPDDFQPNQLDITISEVAQ